MAASSPVDATSWLQILFISFFVLTTMYVVGSTFLKLIFVHNVSNLRSQRVFPLVFTLSASMFVVVLFDLANILSFAARYWMLNAALCLLLFVLAVLPFSAVYSLLDDIGVKNSKINKLLTILLTGAVFGLTYRALPDTDLINVHEHRFIFSPGSFTSAQQSHESSSDGELVDGTVHAVNIGDPSGPSLSPQDSLDRSRNNNNNNKKGRKIKDESREDKVDGTGSEARERKELGASNHNHHQEEEQDKYADGKEEIDSADREDVVDRGTERRKEDSARAHGKGERNDEVDQKHRRRRSFRSIDVEGTAEKNKDPAATALAESVEEGGERDVEGQPPASSGRAEAKQQKDDDERKKKQEKGKNENREEEMEPPTLFEQVLSRAACIGITVMSILSGYGAVMTPIAYLTPFVRRKDKATAQNALLLLGRRQQYVMERWLEKQTQIMTLKYQSQQKASGKQSSHNNGAPGSGSGGQHTRSNSSATASRFFSSFWGGNSAATLTAQAESLQPEVEGIKKVSTSLFLQMHEAEELQQMAQYGQSWRALIFALCGVLLSLYCVAKVGITTVNLLLVRFSFEDPITRSLTIFAGVTTIDVDVPTVVARVALSFNAIMIVSAIRSFLITLFRLTAAYLSGVGANTTILFFSTFMGLYAIAMLLLMRLSLPEQNRGVLTQVVGRLSFMYYHRWYDIIFVVSTALTGVVRWLVLDAPQRG